MASQISDTIRLIIEDDPALSNEDIAAKVREMIPGAATSAASVSSVKSRLKSEGVALPQAELSAQIPATSYGRYAEHDPDETLEEAQMRISKRYRSFERMANDIVEGYYPSLIVSGPPGLGKSFTITEALAESHLERIQLVEEQYDDLGDMDASEIEDLKGEAGAGCYDVISGAITAVGLYIALWNLREGGILVLDDCDDAFRDETALNLLKAVLDSSPVREVSWRKRAHWLEELGIKSTFEFKGSVVFLTNVDFEAAINSGKRDAKHFEALLDRSMYLSLTLRSRRDFMIRIRQVSEGPMGMLQSPQGQFCLSEEEAETVLDFVSEHQTRFYNLSLRLVGQVAKMMKANPEFWQEDAEATKMRTI